MQQTTHQSPNATKNIISLLPDARHTETATNGMTPLDTIHVTGTKLPMAAITLNTRIGRYSLSKEQSVALNDLSCGEYR